MLDLWLKIKSKLENSLPRGQFDLWIAPLEFLGIEGEILKLGCKNYFHIQWIKEKLEKNIFQAAQTFVPSLRKICYEDQGNLPTKESQEDEEKHSPLLAGNPRQLSIGDVCNVTVSKFNPRFTFEEFVTGQCNQLAYASSMAIATGKFPNLTTLYIMSDSGLGKSHLSQAIGNYVFKNAPHLKVRYVTAEQFTNEMVLALKNDSMDKFKQNYRSNCDILLLERVEFFGGKDKIQSELIYTFDELMDRGKKIIYTSSKLPKDIPRLSDDLRSRLSSALLTPIDHPDFETRLNILKKKAARERAKIPLKVLEFIAEYVTGDVRKLESSLMGIIAKSNILGVPVTIELAKDVVEALQEKSHLTTISAIQDLVCETFNITKDHLLSTSRKKNIVMARKIALYLAREYTNETLQDIAKSFRRTHSTVIYSLKEIERSLHSGKDPIKKYLDYVLGKLKAQYILPGSRKDS